MASGHQETHKWLVALATLRAEMPTIPDLEGLPLYTNEVEGKKRANTHGTWLHWLDRGIVHSLTASVTICSFLKESVCMS